MEFSVLNLNSELRNDDKWDEDSIRDRSDRMAQLFFECWPGLIPLGGTKDCSFNPTSTNHSCSYPSLRG